MRCGLPHAQLQKGKGQPFALAVLAPAGSSFCSCDDPACGCGGGGCPAVAKP